MMVKQNNTWTLTELLPNTKTLGRKRIVKKKYKIHDNVDKYKARLMVNSFKQKEGVSYFETLSPITKNYVN